MANLVGQGDSLGARAHVAQLNGGGLSAFDPATATVASIAPGSMDAVAVDSLGVYWGDHPNPGGGTLHMMLKK